MKQFWVWKEGHEWDGYDKWHVSESANDWILSKNPFHLVEKSFLDAMMPELWRLQHNEATQNLRDSYKSDLYEEILEENKRLKAALEKYETAPLSAETKEK